MKTTILKTITGLTVILSLFITLDVNAQTNFSGTWKRNDDETIVEGLSLNSIPITLVVSQDANALSVKRNSRNGQGDESSYIDVLKFDSGTSEVITPSKLKRISGATWSADKKQLTQSFTSKDDQGNIQQSGKQIFCLSDDGKKLKVIVKLHYGDREFEGEEIFDKQ